MNEEQGMERKIQRETTHDDNEDDRSQINPIPLDLISEILPRLPAKSIVRSQSVSKDWSSCTKHQSFINSFAARSCERPPRFLLTFATNSKRFVFSFPQEQNPDGSSSPVESYQMMTRPHDWSFPLSECVQGLVLFCGLVIWNPATRRFINLPKPKRSHEGMSFLGYDPLEGKHKVLHVVNSEHARVLTLRAKETWRTLPTQPWRHIGDAGRCFNGILYFAALFGTPGLEENIIMSFDVRFEKFIPIKLPVGFYICSVDHMVPYEGRVAFVSSHISDNNFDLWVLKDADGHEWAHKRFLVPSHRDTIQGRMMPLLCFHGVTVAGELIFAPGEFSESFYILYFDPRRNSIREALFEGIVGDKQMISLFFTFPNHMESLVSSL